MRAFTNSDRRRTWAALAAGMSTTLILLAAGGAGAQPATSVGAQVANGASARAGTGAVSPLPPSNYRVRRVCPAPSPGRASCLAQELVPVTAAARAHMHPLGMTRMSPLAAPVPAEGGYGLRPEDLKAAYFPGEEPEAPKSEPQTIALIEAYNDLNAQADLETYGQAFKTKLPKLKTCSSPGTVEPECFEKVNEKGETGESELPFPRTAGEAEEALEFCEERNNGSEPLEEWLEKEAACEAVQEAEGWSLEASLDIEIAHAVCQNCRIVLVEAESREDSDLEEAEDTAAEKLHATEISNSWSSPEPEPEHGQTSTVDSPAFDHPGIAITAAAGDGGYLNWTGAEEAKALREPYYSGAEYPASSPHVVAVGGTSLELEETAGKTTWQSETVWNDDHDLAQANNGAGGSGCSSSFEAQPWQRQLPNWSAVGCEDRRAVADVSADGDPYTGVAVYDSETYCEYPYEEAEEKYVVRSPWCTLGGTSVGTPLIAAMFALAGGSHEVAYPAETLYEHLETGLLHTVSGSNGECDGDYASGCTGSMNPSSSRFAFDCGEGVLICNGAAGCERHYYAGPTGVGSPNGIGAFDPEDHPEKDAKACTKEGGSGGGSGEQPHEPTGTSSPQSVSTNSSKGTSISGSAAPSARESTIVPILSAPALTRAAAAAVRRGRPRVAQIAFAFTLNVAARVHVTLAEQVKVHGHERWRTLRYALTIAAAKGRDGAHLSSKQRLAPGRYRLTLTPAGGMARTLTFRAG